MVSKNQRTNRWTGAKKNNLKTAEVACWLIVCPLWNVILAGIWRTSIKVRYPFGTTVKEQEWNKRKNSSVYNSLFSLAVPQSYSSPERHKISNCNTTVVPVLCEKSCLPCTSESTLQCSVTRLSVNSTDNTRSSQASWAALMPLAALRNPARHLLWCGNGCSSSSRLF